MSSRNKAAGPSQAKRKKDATRARNTRTDEETGAREPLFDSNTRVDIAAVAVTVIALVLLFSMLVPETGILSNAVSRALSLSLGIGAYLVPVLVFVWGISIFVNRDPKAISRLGLGFLCVAVAILSFLAVLSPGAGDVPTAVFDERYLASRGGYLGSCIAYVFLSLFGKAIAIVLVVALAVVGLLVSGFSISRLVERLRTRRGTSRLGFGRHTEPEKRTSLLEPSEGTAATEVAPTVPASDAEQTELMPHDEETSELTVVAPTQNLSEDTRVRRPSKRRRSTSDEGASSGADARTSIHQASEPTALAGFELPDPSLLSTSADTGRLTREAQASLKDTAAHLQQTLADFDLDAKVTGWVSGPTFTMFKVDMPAGVRLSKITGLQNDIALALAAESVRIFAPIPGTSLVGVEIPNKRRATVLLGDVLNTVSGGPLMLALGKDVEGDAISADLAKMPHLLIGGTTGSGKSVAINSMLISILMRATPAEVRMVLIDPKRVELSVYNGIPHLYVPVVTDPKKAASVLAWATIEMDRRLKLLESVEARDIGAYNAKVQSGELDESEGELPYLVIVIDELSDLMMVSGKEVEGSITRIAQLGRAAGMHLIVATQRPSSNVVTGMIKANIVNRIAFKVATGLESRVILDQNGADKLIGTGDMLFLSGSDKPRRIQGCFVNDSELAQVVEHLKEQGEPDYHDEILSTQATAAVSGGQGAGSSDDDPLLWEAAEMVVESQLGSTSNIQRRLHVGYSRAGRIMDQLYEKGIVGPPDGSKPREVLVSDTLELETIRTFDENGVGDEESL